MAIGIVSCARFASDSMLISERGEPNLEPRTAYLRTAKRYNVGIPGK